MSNVSGKTVAELIAELRDELKEFISTRAAMFHAEMSGTIKAYKTAAPAVAVGSVMLLTGWLVLTALLVVLVSMAFSAPWNYVVALLIVGGIYVALGGAIAWAGWRSIKEHKLTPERTIKTLQQDQKWLQTEAKTQL